MSRVRMPEPTGELAADYARAAKIGELPNDGGPIPGEREDEVAIVRIAGGCIWPPDRHEYGAQDVLAAWQEFLGAYDQAHADCPEGESIMKWLTRSMEENRAWKGFCQTLERALEDAMARGYALGLDATIDPRRDEQKAYLQKAYADAKLDAVVGARFAGVAAVSP